MDNINDIFKLDSNVKSKHYKKGSAIQTEGDKSKYSYFVKKGLLRSYTIDNKGKEHIYMFAPEGWMIGDMESQVFNQPAKLFIDCIEPSEIIAVDRTEFNKLELSKAQLNKNVTLLSRRIAVLQRRVIMLMSATAIERYELFLETYPELSNRIPQRMIASYLGITPQALSTLRGNIARKKL
jgi:CRP-like cAMP-binding protein